MLCRSFHMLLHHGLTYGDLLLDQSIYGRTLFPNNALKINRTQLLSKTEIGRVLIIFPNSITTFAERAIGTILKGDGEIPARSSRKKNNNDKFPCGRDKCHVCILHCIFRRNASKFNNDVRDAASHLRTISTNEKDSSKILYNKSHVIVRAVRRPLRLNHML